MSNNPIQAAFKQVNVHDLQFVSLFSTIETGVLGETERVGEIIDDEAYERFETHGFYNPWGTGFLSDRTHCDCCGHRLDYVCVIGAPDNRFFGVGRDCFIALGCDAESVESASVKVVRRTKRERENAARERKIADIAAKNVGFTEAYAAARKETVGIAADIAGKIARYGEPSEKQVAFLIRWHQERIAAQERIKASPLTLGKASVVGTLVSAKFRRLQGFYGGEEAKLALVVALESGHKVYAKIPLGTPYDVAETLSFPEGLVVPSLVGSTVAFKATLEPSENDSAFVFAKRVTKLTINGLPFEKPTWKDGGKGIVRQWAEEATRVSEEPKREREAARLAEATAQQAALHEFQRAAIEKFRAQFPELH